MDKTNFTYKDCVNYGKHLLKEIESSQIEICELAMKVVTITQGGIGSKKFYTIQDFANDIGMNENTLSKWLEIYNDVYTKFETIEEKNNDWKKAKKINKNLKHERKLINEKNNSRGSQFGRKNQDLSPSRINALKNEIDEKPFVSEFTRCNQDAIRMYNLFQKRDLSIIDEASLSHLMQVLDYTSDLINNHLTEKKYGKAV